MARSIIAGTIKFFWGPGGPGFKKDKNRSQLTSPVFLCACPVRISAFHVWSLRGGSVRSRTFNSSSSSFF